MYCQRCGAQLPENTSGCPLCGAEYRVENTTPIINAKKVPQKSFFTKKKITITAIIAAILILGGIVAAITLINGSISTTDLQDKATIYADLQDMAQIISNGCNARIADVTMLGIPVQATTITGEKTNGSLLKIKADGKDELDDSLGKADKLLISKLTNDWDEWLPNDCWFSIEVGSGRVTGVIYTTTNPVELLPPVGDEAEVYKVKEFVSAYKLTDKNGIDIGVSGSYMR